MNAVNTTECIREMSDVKQKWQDVRSVAKRREAERIRTGRDTGGGPAPVDEAKPWERVVSIFR